MIRARLSNGDYLFGIDAENVRRLLAGMPIVVDLALMGGQNKILIVYGADMADLTRQLEEATGGPLPPAQPLPGGEPRQ